MCVCVCVCVCVFMYYIYIYIYIYMYYTDAFAAIFIYICTIQMLLQMLFQYTDAFAACSRSLAGSRICAFPLSLSRSPSRSPRGKRIRADFFAGGGPAGESSRRRPRRLKNVARN